MILKRFNYLNGMSLLTLLITLTVFSGIFLAINQWTAQQRKTGMETYLRYQAIQIAENQKQRQFLQLPCEQHISQNGQQFDVQCQTDKVKVRYQNEKFLEL